MTLMLVSSNQERRLTKVDRTTSLGDIEIFAEVVDAGTMTAAAQRLGLAVPVISKRIQRLEAKLGARLLDRSTRRIVLTEAGQGFHHCVGRILEAFEEAVGFASEVSTSLTGTLRVLAPTSFGRMHLAPHLPRFLEAHPSLELDLELDDREVDIAISGFHLALRVGQLSDSSLIAKKLAPVRQVLCAAPTYLARFGDPQSLDELKAHELVSAEPEWPLIGTESRVSIPVRGRLRTRSGEAIREAVINGAGIGLLPTWKIYPELADGRLRVVLPCYQREGCGGVFAVYTSKELMPRKARSLLEFLTSTYGVRPYWEGDRSLWEQGQRDGPRDRHPLPQIAVATKA